jgi:hypothetical protein
MSHFIHEVKAMSATAGHLAPQSVNASATAAPSTGGWISGATLLAAGRALAAFVQTGAFVSTPSMAFHLRVATDADGTGGAAVTGGTIATIAAANTAASAALSLSLVDATKFYAIGCTATGGTSGFVAGQLRVLDPAVAP